MKRMLVVPDRGLLGSDFAKSFDQLSDSGYDDVIAVSET